MTSHNHLFFQLNFPNNKKNLKHVISQTAFHFTFITLVQFSTKTIFFLLASHLEVSSLCPGGAHPHLPRLLPDHLGEVPDLLPLLHQALLEALAKKDASHTQCCQTGIFLEQKKKPTTRE